MQGSTSRAFAALVTAVLISPIGQLPGVRAKTHYRSPHICRFDRKFLRSTPGTCRPRALTYPGGATGYVRRAIYDSAMTFGVPYRTLLDTAECESSLNPHAHAGPYYGLFQFLPGTFQRGRRAMHARTGVQARSYWNARDASYVAGFLFASGEASNWSCVPRSD